MKIIYICSAYGGDLQNYVKSKAYCREVIREGNLPVAPQVFLPPLIQRGEGESKEEREYTLAAAETIIPHCDEMRVYGHEITSDMQKEIDIANEYRMAVKYEEANRYHEKENTGGENKGSVR